MGSKIFVGLMTVAIAAAAWASEPWKDKAFKDWDENELRKVLFDSPWARQVRISATWAGGGRDLLPGGGAGGQQPMSGVAVPGQGEQEVGAPETPRDTESTRQPEASFVIRWSSALTIRQAFARTAILRNRLKEADAAIALAQPVTDYQVSVVGSEMAPFARSDETALKEKSYLRLKKSKLKLAPERVEILRAEGGKKINTIVFHFSRKTPSGEATIPSDERGVEFVCPAGNIQLKTSFDLQKMIGREGVDL